MNFIQEWPEGKTFAFTVFDDSDHATIDNVKIIYDLLEDYGFRTTKSVWPLSGKQDVALWLGGSTCEDPDYLAWIKELQSKGFEIGYHNATYHTSVREETISAITRFEELFGHNPKSMANHFRCKQNIYWGDSRLTGINRFIYNILTRFRNAGVFKGHVDGDKHFWGDICKQKVKYVRNFVFPETNTLRACPFMPYHDPTKPYVNYWFSSSEGGNVQLFNERIDERNQDRLEEEGGACIMYAFFAKGFSDKGRVNSRFKFLMERLAKKNGWFVPVSTLLDHLLKTNGNHIITDAERSYLERKWLRNKLRIGTT